VSYFAQLGKTIIFGTATLTNGSPGPTTVFTPKSDEWTDVYTVLITTNDTAIQQITVSDGTKSIVYFVGGSGGAIPVLDEGSTPVRFGKGLVITATAGAVTAGKSVVCNIRGLSSKT
jgi:hypothetical protein